MNLMTIPYAPDDVLWQKVLAHDKASDGSFVYAVRTTGIYCRPSCPSRRAKRENIQFFQRYSDAEQAGFRACKRCNPQLAQTLATQDNNRHAELVAKACYFIETSDDAPDLDAIANSVDLSPSHFHRIFKVCTGLTPKAYSDAHRADKMRDALREKDNRITDAIYDAGYSSPSRFYEVSARILGMKPKTYQSGGMNEDIHFAIGQSELGAVLIAMSNKGICAILIDDDPSVLIRDLEQRFPKANLIGADQDYEKLVAQVIGLIEDPAAAAGSTSALPLDLRGTVFQKKVWQALRDIPVGTTLSYTELANKLGMPKAFRAVAQACAANKIAVAVPCHRVVRNDGGLSGYRWGVERKGDLLKREQQD